jgi:hypothetical protein
MELGRSHSDGKSTFNLDERRLAQTGCRSFPPPPRRLTTFACTQHLCLPPELTPLCTTVPVYIPSCDEPPPPPMCTNPESYSTRETCEAAFCRWMTPPQQAPYCTYP